MWKYKNYLKRVIETYIFTNDNFNKDELKGICEEFNSMTENECKEFIKEGMTIFKDKSVTPKKLAFVLETQIFENKLINEIGVPGGIIGRAQRNYSKLIKKGYSPQKAKEMVSKINKRYRPGGDKTVSLMRTSDMSHNKEMKRSFMKKLGSKVSPVNPRTKQMSSIASKELNKDADYRKFQKIISDIANK